MTFSGMLYDLLPGRKTPESGKRIVRFLAEHPAVPQKDFLYPAMRMVYLSAGNGIESGGFVPLLSSVTDSAGLPEILNSVQDPTRALEHIKSLSTLSPTQKRESGSFFLDLIPLHQTLTPEICSEWKTLCAAMGLSTEETEKILTEEEERRKNKAKRLNSGAGLIAALLVLLLFVFAALYLKTVFFGFLLAYLFLPLERFFEKRIFGTRIYQKLEWFFLLPFRPFFRLRDFFTGKKQDAAVATPEQKRSTLAAKSAGLTVCSLLAAVIGICILAVLILTPFAMRTGKNIASWAERNEIMSKANEQITRMMDKQNEVPEEQRDTTIAAKKQLPEKINASDLPIRQKLRLWLEENLAGQATDLLHSTFSASGDVLGFLLSLVGSLGTFLMDLLLCIFFFFVFLQQMAFYTNDVNRNTERSVGTWMIGTIYNSGWFPATDEETRQSASEIIDRICTMFDRWLRGYFWIFAIEFALYSVFFTLFNVPYAIPLAMLAGCNILLPFLGPVITFTITTAVTLAFAPQVIVPLTGVVLAFFIINGILEQIILYPSFVGEAIGLTTMETIIVVLLGGAVAGIIGMIIAVPVAALVKFLIPIAYKTAPRFRDIFPRKNG